MTTRFAQHSAFSDPGSHGHLLRQLSGIEEICAAVTNLGLHYTAEAHLLRADRRHEINARWISTILDLDQARHPRPLLHPRPPADRVAGCCRDHALLAVAALREHQIPARTRVGFTPSPDFCGDHVIAEWWNGTRWQRFDPELQPGSRTFNIRDFPTGEGAPFQTAAEVWTAYRASHLDPTRYGAHPALAGPTFIRAAVVHELLHRNAHETLLWDEVGLNLTDPEADELARLLLAADTGNPTAEADVAHHATRLRPTTVTQLSPYGDQPVTVDL
ncbi:transglutaminase domain-containing protein [Kribbella antibiotica]|uniref:Transglutaminase domain-containing protein n=1 Tax=Kribbella antibiotica TaxID=190195 RepID=A0A4V2YPF3_9ACTN|nr:transglutaminase-like domain-containing protein [Kribbella antibiotica]TDD58047.1 transglutaminase domain-containing protein [Kribbella antibiotica]